MAIFTEMSGRASLVEYALRCSVSTQWAITSTHLDSSMGFVGLGDSLFTVTNIFRLNSTLVSLRPSEFSPSIDDNKA